MFSNDNAASQPSYDDSWFVYLLPTIDNTTFKVGFSHNPLQRLHSFNRRFFERFDLERSLLLQVESCGRAREAETALKKSLADFRTESPSWVDTFAGGETEWYGSSEFADAADRLRDFSEGTATMKVADFVRNALNRFAASFELWAVEQSRRLHDDWVAVNLGHERRVTALALRDWLDTYRFFDIELFRDDAAAFEFVKAGTRLRHY